jgi:phage baseplate assembly protein W
MPINFKALIQKREVDVCSYHESIAQNIFLILTTKYQESRFDPEFGTELWDWDFQYVPNEMIWLDKISKNVKNSILKYEPRLYEVEVDIKIEQEDLYYFHSNLHHIKKKLEVFVKAQISKTREPFHFSQVLYISPISFD